MKKGITEIMHIHGDLKIYLNYQGVPENIKNKWKSSQNQTQQYNIPKLMQHKENSPKMIIDSHEYPHQKNRG